MIMKILLQLHSLMVLQLPLRKKNYYIEDALVNAATIFANACAVQPPQRTGSPSKRSSDVKLPGSNSFLPISSAKLRRSCLDLRSLNYIRNLCSADRIVGAKGKNM